VDGGCSPADIKALVKRLRNQGIDIDMVIVDYLELMSPNRQIGTYAKREMRHVFGQQIKEMRSTAVALQVPLVSAWQINRAGSEVDTVTMAHVSECYDLNKHADIILGLNQSIGEANNNQMRIGVLKQRDNTARPQIYVRSDLDRCTVLPINNQEEAPDENATIDATAETAKVS
jgi:replicative DNA helicase